MLSLSPADLHVVWMPGGGSLRGVADAFADTPTNGQREQLPGVDVLYLKNVLLKFLDSAAAGRTEQVLFHCLLSCSSSLAPPINLCSTARILGMCLQNLHALCCHVQCDALLPAIATLVRASPQEYVELKASLHSGRQSASWWPS